MKKYLGVLVSVGMFLVAGTALAAAYAPGTMMNTTNSNSVMLNAQKMPGYMSQLQQGTLSAQDQQDMYKLMTTPNSGTVTIQQAQPFGSQPMMQINGNQTWGNGMMSPAKLSVSSMGAFTNEGAAWFALMNILTIILVWVVLLLLIALLWKHVKKH